MAQILSFNNKTLESQPETPCMVDKKLFYVQDQNGGTFNGQILFDTSVLSSSGQWLAYSEAYIQISFDLTFQSSTDVTAANTYIQGFTMGLKNGYYQLIDSIQVDYNNKNIIALQPFTNFFVNYKLMSSLSADDLKKQGSSIGFIPDSAGSAAYAAAANANDDEQAIMLLIQHQLLHTLPKLIPKTLVKSRDYK